MRAFIFRNATFPRLWVLLVLLGAATAYLFNPSAAWNKFFQAGPNQAPEFQPALNRDVIFNFFDSLGADDRAIYVFYEGAADTAYFVLFSVFFAVPAGACWPTPQSKRLVSGLAGGVPNPLLGFGSRRRRRALADALSCAREGRAASVARGPCNALEDDCGPDRVPVQRRCGDLARRCCRGWKVDHPLADSRTVQSGGPVVGRASPTTTLGTYALFFEEDAHHEKVAEASKWLRMVS